MQDIEMCGAFDFLFFFLSQSYKKVIFIDGKITEVGTFQELVQAQGHFAEFLEEFLMDKVRQRRQSLDERDCEFHFNFYSEM